MIDVVERGRGGVAAHDTALRESCFTLACRSKTLKRQGPCFMIVLRHGIVHQLVTRITSSHIQS